MRYKIKWVEMEAEVFTQLNNPFYLRRGKKTIQGVELVDILLWQKVWLVEPGAICLDHIPVEHFKRRNRKVQVIAKGTKAWTPITDIESRVQLQGPRRTKSTLLLSVDLADFEEEKKG